MKRSDCSLPEDLVIEILSFLPFKSLLRFKCVRKSWYDLFVSPNFASKHINNSDNDVSSDHHRLIFGFHAVPNENGDFWILSYDTLNVIVKKFRFRYDYEFLSNSKEYWFKVYQRLLGSYNGLVCLADVHLKEFAFWNPATRQSKLVRQSNKITARHKHTEHAFGYDFKRNDYKVMRISPLTNEPPYIYETEVYSFNTDTWRNSDAVIPEGICFDDCDDRPTICVNGIYSTMAYTHAKEGEKRNYFLFTIDMSNEAFILTPMSEAVNFEAYSWRYKVLAELNKSVVFMKYEKGLRLHEESFVVFTLNDYGPNGIWTKLYKISSLPELIYEPHHRPKYPIGIWKNELLFDIGYNGLILLNPRTHKWKNLGHGGVYKQILEYKESLVWINEGYHPLEKKKLINFFG